MEPRDPQAFPDSMHIHGTFHNKIDEVGYDEAHTWLKANSEPRDLSEDPYLKSYVERQLHAYGAFLPFRDELMELTLALDREKLRAWAYATKAKGFSKKAIYEILGEQFVYLQRHPKTRDDEVYYDFIADFLDLFTDWGGSNRIFP